MRIDMYVIRQGHSTNRCFLESQVGLVGLLLSCCCVGEWRAVEKCILCDNFFSSKAAVRHIAFVEKDKRTLCTIYFVWILYKFCSLSQEFLVLTVNYNKTSKRLNTYFNTLNV